VFIWENTEARILLIECVIIWTTLFIAIIMCTRDYSGNQDLPGTTTKDAKGQNTGAKADSKPKPPMLNFVTVDEIYNMPLEVLQSVPKEHLEQLPMDKRAIVKRRINELIQAERAKQNK